MSYCVNCGVELEKNCRECPLCDTPVINPREKISKDKSVYPDEIHIPRSLSKKYVVFVLTMILLIPNLVLLLLNIFILDSHLVSYIIGGFVVAWIWFLFPFLWKKQIPVISLAVDAIALLVYLYMFNFYGDENGWYYSIVLPVVIVLWAICNLFIFWLKKPRSKPLMSIAVLGAVSIMSFVIEICMMNFYFSRLEITVSLIITACCVSLMAFFVAMEKSKRLRAWIQRKFFM